MAYMGWPNRETWKTWEEIVRTQDTVLPLVEAAAAAGPRRDLVKRLAEDLKEHFYRAMPLQETEGGRYVHDYWSSLLSAAFSEIAWKTMAHTIVWQLANPELHPDLVNRGARKQDWAARDRLWP